MLNSWGVGDLFNCHQWTPLQAWWCFQPGNRYLPALSNHQTGNLRDDHKHPQLKAAKPDLWDHATSFEPTQGCQKCDYSGHAGLIQWVHWVVVYPICTTSLWRAVVLVTLMQGSIDTGCQATQLAHKQLKTLTQGAQDNLEHVLGEQIKNTSL